MIFIKQAKTWNKLEQISQPSTVFYISVKFVIKEYRPIINISRARARVCVCVHSVSYTHLDVYKRQIYVLFIYLFSILCVVIML